MLPTIDKGCITKEKKEMIVTRSTIVENKTSANWELVVVYALINELVVVYPLSK